MEDHSRLLKSKWGKKRGAKMIMAKMFKVTDSNIRAIADGKTWNKTRDTSIRWIKPKNQ
jgi:hypothetical protein